MPIYCCNHCGISSETTFEVFLHIFTDHLHKDIGVGKQEVQGLLKKTYLYQVTSYAFSLN
jgi:hypothetical protein